jgi:hypothetical protein
LECRGRAPKHQLLRPRFFPFLADHYLAPREPRSVSI